MNSTDKITREIKEFHYMIEEWFRGNAPDQEILYQKLLSGFTPEFRMINGNGNTVTLSDLSGWLPGVYGKFPNRVIILENIEVESTDNHGLASYTEIQITGTETTRRHSSAVFLLNDEKALWLHLIEKWVL